MNQHLQEWSTKNPIEPKLKLAITTFDDKINELLLASGSSPSDALSKHTDFILKFLTSTEEAIPGKFEDLEKIPDNINKKYGAIVKAMLEELYLPK